MKLYGGIDLHSNNNVVTLLDEKDQVIYQRRLRNDSSHILSELAPYQEALQGLAVESTYNWYWLVDGLMEAGYQLHLVNTAAVKQYEGLKYSDDHSDSRWLAHLLRLDILPQGYIYPKAGRAVRDGGGQVLILAFIVLELDFLEDHTGFWCLYFRGVVSLCIHDEPSWNT